MTKNKIINGMREMVKTLENEGFSEDIFGFAFGQEEGKDFLQAWSYDFEPVELGATFPNSWKLARDIMALAKKEYGEKCQSVNSLVCDETSEEVFLNGSVLMVMCLNV